MSIERIIGIDFGTSTSFIKVKRYKDGKAIDDDRLDSKAVVFDGKGSIAIPTIIQTLGEQVWYGYDAETVRPNALIYRNFKVDLECPDPEKQNFAKDLTKKFFSYLYKKYNEQRNFFGEPTDNEKTFVSYPAKWSSNTRQFMLSVAREAGFKNVEGMDEASAAIHAVIIQEIDNLKDRGYIQENCPLTLLLIDMGAGTSDLAVCRYTPGITPKNEIIATWPKSNINILFGGRELDELLGDFIGWQLSKNGIEQNIVNNVKKLRLNEIKAWKEYTVSDSLSRNKPVLDCMVLDSFYMYSDKSAPPMPVIDRAYFEQMTYTYLTKFTELINGCLEHTRKNVPSFKGGESIDLVILTGGHCQWYFTKEILTGKLSKFGNVNLPLLKGNRSRILQMARPQETVSLGLVYSKLQVDMNKASTTQSNINTSNDTSNNSNKKTDEKPTTATPPKSATNSFNKSSVNTKTVNTGSVFQPFFEPLEWRLI